MSSDCPTEKKVKFTIDSIPQYKGEHDSITKINEVTILSYDDKEWFITFKSDDFNWVTCITSIPSKGRDQLAALFNTKPRRTNDKINGMCKYYDKYHLFNEEGKIICICEGFEMSEDYNTCGALFVCDVPNPEALSQISLKEKSFQLNKQNFPGN